MFNNYPDVVNVRTLTKMLGVGRSTAYNLLRKELICYKRVGKRYLIPKSEVIRFLLCNMRDDGIETWYTKDTKSVLSETEDI